MDKIYLIPIGYLIVLFASLIYNEIIILNFCNLSKDTKKFIEDRINEEKKEFRKEKIEIEKGALKESEDNSNIDGNDREELSIFFGIN